MPSINTHDLPPRPRRLLAPEVVQTSTMDCGPAALKCVLEGWHLPISYGRLREACQTSVDGTSIDALEDVAQQLGLQAEQVMVPVDHLLRGPAALPAIVVVRHADAATHFVVVWRRLGGWLQVMDPAIGRRWLRARDFLDEVYRHQAEVDAADWRAWAGTADFTTPLQQRLQALGLGPAAAQKLIAEALQDEGWLAIAGLDAAARALQSLVDAGGCRRGAEAATLLQALWLRGVQQALQAPASLSPAHWSVRPGPGEDRLLLAGAVLLRIAGRRAPAATGGAAGTATPLSAELAAALRERPEQGLASAWRLLRADGLLAPLALAGAGLLASGGLMLEALLMRGLFDAPALLGLAHQRLGALAGLGALLTLLLMIEWPIAAETLRQGRQLETRLRMALLRKLPRLNDRYFQSRPISDMAERSHGLQLTRAMPALAFGLLRALCQAALTLAGVLWLAPASAGWALALLAASLLTPLAVQPLLNERDLRARNHAAALNGFYLDALLGLVPVRAHRAETNVARQHESLLVDWTSAMRSGLRIGLWADAVQGLLCTGLALALLAGHFAQAGSVGGADLLLLYWTLQLPALGGRVAGLLHQYPAQRNVLLRLLEPLSAPEDLAEPAPRAVADAAIDGAGAVDRAPAALPGHGGVALRIDAGTVLAGGHEILREVQLRIAPGEHVAIVGVSGAGKSSLLGLLLGWHRLSAGQLQVDGRALDSAAMEALRRVTAWVDPAIQVWNSSLLDNLGYASEAPALARLGEVLATARLRGLLARLPQGLQTLLGEGGALLSGGEGQRVRLGRALLATDTRLVLLDEPFRGLDRPQRHALLGEVRAWWQGVTLLCVTHDVGETQGFDRVLVVEHGRIVEDGAPAALRAGSGRYRALLDAEQRLRQSVWQGPQWRHLVVQGGQVQARGAAP